MFLILILTCFTLEAQESDNSLLSLKLMQLYLDKNQLEKVEEIYDDYEDVLSKKWMALERLAISFERRSKYKDAIEIYRKLILNFNSVSHAKILNTRPSEINEVMFSTNKLPLYYYKLAFLNTQLFISSHNYTLIQDKKKFKNNAEGFIGLLRKVKSDESEIKLLEEQLSEKISADEKLIYHASNYLFFEVASWQDRLILIESTTGVRTNLLSTAIGPCLGGGRKWQNSKYEFNFEGCFFNSTSTISSQDKSVSYQQSSVPVNGFFTGPGFYFKSFSENVLLGFHIPFMYTRGDWTIPPGNYYFRNTTLLGGGYFLQSKFKVGKFSIRTRLGKIFPKPSSQWSIGLIYDF